MIRVECICGGRFRAQDEHAGKRAKCPACGEVIVVPAIQGDCSAESDSKQDHCPSCQALLNPGDILCIECGYHTEQRRKLDKIHATSKRKAYVPWKTYRVTEEDDQLRFENIQRVDSRLVVLTTVVTASVISIFFISLVWLTTDSALVVFTASGSVICLFSYLAGVALVKALNKTSCSVTRENLRVCHSIPWFRQVNIPRDQMAKIFVLRGSVGSADSGSVAVWFDVMALTTQGKRKKLLSVHDRSEAIRIKETIESFLQIPHEALPHVNPRLRLAWKIGWTIALFLLVFCKRAPAPLGLAATPPDFVV